MISNESRLMQIEKWARRLSYYYLIVFGLVIIGTIIQLIQVWRDPYASPYLYVFYGANIRYGTALFVSESLATVLASILPYLALRATAASIRYLLALKAKLVNARDIRQGLIQS